MTINTSALGGGSSPLGLSAFTSGVIASGAAAGDLITVSASGATQYIKVNFLAGSADQVNITLTVDGNNVFSGATLYTRNNPSAGASGTGFAVLSGYGLTNNTASARVMPFFICKAFTLTLDSGSTVADIDYAYETLEELL